MKGAHRPTLLVLVYEGQRLVHKTTAAESFLSCAVTVGSRQCELGCAGKRGTLSNGF
jgi:hypothetical protein